jgi:hypothetical protein
MMEPLVITASLFEQPTVCNRLSAHTVTMGLPGPDKGKGGKQAVV